MRKDKVVIIATEGLATNLLYEQLENYFDVVQVILEQPEKTSAKIRRRFRKQPFFHVIGQLAFIGLLVPLMKRGSKKRIAQIITSAGFSGQGIPAEKILQIENINQDYVPEMIQRTTPAFVFVNGTRIIRKEILDAVGVPVYNIHVGITPAYRGIHGGYWALYHSDRENFGVTLHHVDPGVDTGAIIAQKILEPSKADSFLTYPVLQYCEGLRLINPNLHNLPARPSGALNMRSKQHYHPRFFPYLMARWFRGVR
jgi:phosphoribosylglycinamide formyltransferase 1